MEMIRKETVFAWMNKQIKANKLTEARLLGSKIMRSHRADSIHVYRGIKLISEITGLVYHERDWDGNEHCGTNYLERYIIYKGYRFFELASAEDFKEEDAENEEEFAD